jgi:sugar phosphate permease
MCILVIFTKESKQKTNLEKISKKHSHSYSALTDLNIWLVASALVLSGVPLVAFLTWGTTYLSATRELSIGYASYVVSLCSAGGILGSIVGGLISDKIQSRKKVFLPAFVFCLFLYFLLPLVTNLFLPFVLFALGCAFNSGSSPIIACVSDLCDKRQVGLGMGIVNISTGAILFFGPLTFGLLYSIMESWNSTLNLLALFYIIAIIFGLLARNVK